MPDSAPMSARPATFGFSTAMTLPMSCGPVAPDSAIVQSEVAEGLWMLEGEAAQPRATELLQRALRQPDLVDKAVRRYVAKSTPGDKPEMAEQLRLTATREALRTAQQELGGLQRRVEML